MNPAQHFGNFLQLLTAGFLTGIVYGLMCVGLSIIVGIMRIVNIAQGEFAMLGMYVAYYCFGLLGIQILFGDFPGIYVAALAAGPIVFLIGTGLYRLLIGQLSGTNSALLDADGHSARLVLTLGMSLILSYGGRVLFGSAPPAMATPSSAPPMVAGTSIGEDVLISISPGQALAASIAIIVVGIVMLLMTRTRLGWSLRAAADNPEAAIYTGIDVDRAYRIVFGLGVAITAVGGGLLASIEPFQPHIGIEFVIVMYAGVVLGGLGSVGGAFLGGLVIGLIQQLSVLVLPPELHNALLFVCLLLIVLLRPDGLFGKAGHRV